MMRIGWAGRSLGAVVMIGLTLTACATPRGGAAPSGLPMDAADVDVAKHCQDFPKRFSYAEKTVAGRLAVSAILSPIAVGVGLGATAFGDVRGLALAVMAPVEMGRWTAKASQDNKEQADRLRSACEEGGGPDTVVAARAVRDLAITREREKSNRDAARLYRDELGTLDRAGAGESEDAALAALSLASLIERQTPADPELGSLYDRAVRVRETERDTRPRDLAYVLTLYGRWLRAAGRPQDADAVEAKRNTLNLEADAAEAAARAAAAAAGRASSTEIIVGDQCAESSVSALDQLNQEIAAQGGMARILAVDCDMAGQISVVRLTTPAGATDALTFADQEPDPAGRVRAALFAPAP